MNHKASSFFGLAFIISLTVVPQVAFGQDASTSPGNNSFFVAHQGFADPCCQVTRTGTINVGSSNTVLKVDAAFKEVNTSDCSPTAVDMFPPQVNGVVVNPEAAPSFFISAGASCAPGPFNCPTITGTYWLDIDAAEAAHPGQFVGQPLNVTISGRWFGVACSVNNSLTMSAVVVNK